MKTGLLIFCLMASFYRYANTGLQDPVLSASITRGKELYADFCMQCHLSSGKGTKGTVPPLAKSDYLLKNRKESIMAVKYGQSGKITVNGVSYNGMMPNPNLSDDEIADVMNFILNSWGNSSKQMVTPDEVKNTEK